MLIMLLLLSVTGCSSRESGAGVQRTSDGAPRVPEISRLRLPVGFKIDAYATDLDSPRLMALSPDGRLFVTEMGAGRVTILPNSGGFASSHITYASGLNQPHGIAFHGGYLYVAETNRVVRFPYRNGDNSGRSKEVVISGIPAGGRHFTRTISFGPDGRLYLSVGSSCNVCVESNPQRAAVSRYNADGTGKAIIATGLRNAVGHAWNPSTGQLWVTDNGRDYLGDNTPPDEVDVIVSGGFYGWPYAYGNRLPDPQFGSRSPAKVRSTIPPKIAIQAHSAPLGLTFYTGNAFPQEYRGNLFIAYHGSWNRSVPTGYKVVRFNIRGENVVGGQKDFITGWYTAGSAWGRPVGILVGRQGELYITDDTGGRVYIVTYGR